jgi:hypothetical protein
MMMYKKNKTKKNINSYKKYKHHKRSMRLKTRKIKGGGNTAFSCGSKPLTPSTFNHVMEVVRPLPLKGGSCSSCGNNGGGLNVLKMMQKGGSGVGCTSCSAAMQTGGSGLVAWDRSNPGSGGNYFPLNKEFGATSAPDAPDSPDAFGTRQPWPTQLGPQLLHSWQKGGKKGNHTSSSMKKSKKSKKMSKGRKQKGGLFSDVKNVFNLGKYGVGSGINAMNGFSNDGNRNPLPWEGQFPKGYSPYTNQSSVPTIANVKGMYESAQQRVGSM